MSCLVKSLNKNCWLSYPLSKKIRVWVQTYGVRNILRKFLTFFGMTFLRVVEEIRQNGKIPSSINTMFIAIIPKMDCPSSFGDFYTDFLVQLHLKNHREGHRNSTQTYTL
jgi:hypothetical protein